MKKFFISFFLLICILTILFSFTLLFFDKILIFSINKFTNYNVFCETAKLDLSPGLQINELSLSAKDQNLSIRCHRVNLSVFIDKLINDKEVFCRVNLDEVSVGFTERKNENAQKEDVLTLLCKPEEIYSIITFDLSLKNGDIKISDFKAYSENIHINGNYRGINSTEEIFLDVKISFSPSIASNLDPVIKNSILSVDEDGWYSLIIDYKGNPAFLKALYMVAA